MAFFGLFGGDTEFEKQNKAAIKDMKNHEPKSARPQLAFMWELEVVDRQGTGEKVGFYAKTTAMPASITESVKHYVCGSEYSYAGRDVSPRVLRITFFDNEWGQVWGFFDYWRLITNEGKAKRKLRPKYYQRDVVLRYRTSGNEENIVHVFKDCYPIEVGEVALSYSDSGEVTFDVLIAFHTRQMKGGKWWKPIFTPTFGGKVLF